MYGVMAADQSRFVGVNKEELPLVVGLGEPYLQDTPQQATCAMTATVTIHLLF